MTSHWQERITRDTPPAILAEHDLRYRLVAPLVRTSAAWADLGCGSGVAASPALTEGLPAHVVLIDLDPAAVSHAAAELGVADAVTLDGDLTDPAVLASVTNALLDVEGDRVVSCFEVVEHLKTFVPLLEWATDLAQRGKATFVMSVPNDAFWAIENPFHQARWSEGAFDELRRLLPSEHTLLRQVALTGSALVRWNNETESHHCTVSVGGERTVTSHFITAFGPRHAELTRGAVAMPIDQLEQRRWERQRESDLAFLEADLADKRASLKTLLAEREKWRTYIHELERELGRPLSGGESS